MCVDAADYDGAATQTLRVYGPELLAFLASRLGDQQHAREAFAWLAEDIWRGLPNFRGDSSFRTWTYAIARNVIRRYTDRELRARMQAVPLSDVSRASALMMPPPTLDGVDERVRRIRAQLDDEEQLLLTLRIDKSMDWNDVARVMLYEGSSMNRQSCAQPLDFANASRPSRTNCASSRPRQPDQSPG